MNIVLFLMTVHVGYGLGFHLCGHGVVEDGVDGAVDVRARLFKHWRLFISIIVLHVCI